MNFGKTLIWSHYLWNISRCQNWFWKKDALLLNISGALLKCQL